MAKSNKAKKKKGGMANVFRGIFLGSAVSLSFFGRNKFTFALVVGLFMVYITFKYECQTSMEKIAKLENRLAVVKSESVKQKSTYMSRTRESNMQLYIDSLNLPLKLQEKPPYKLTLE